MNYRWPQWVFRKRGMQVYPRIVAVRVSPTRAMSLSRWKELAPRTGV